MGLPGAFTHTLGSAGAEDYSLVLPAGVVAVRYVPDADLCAASPEGPLPCTGGVLLAGVNIVDDGVLDLITTHTDVRERQVGFVFQHYALFRHMTVFDNVAFGMRMKPRGQRPAEAKIREKVHELLNLVQLD